MYDLNSISLFGETEVKVVTILSRRVVSVDGLERKRGYLSNSVAERSKERHWLHAVYLRSSFRIEDFATTRWNRGRR